ncbi:hypothetical protein, partial [Streptomyces sp. NPDC059949]|uniref:hypothetical protein n=1 Tax=Streptomyces sp. NPDC059949 TaxID=3347013 RepID=UPI00365AC672
MAAAVSADAWIGPDTLLHLGSASDGDRNKDLENPHSYWSEALFALDRVLCGEADESLVAAQGCREAEKGQVVAGM